MRISNKIKKHVTQELWENAVFNPDSLEIIKKSVRQTFKNKKQPNEFYLDYKSTLDHLSTVRNQLLITTSEQKDLQNTVVVFFGMSVGSNAAITWMMESRANTIKIVDPDTISPSNLNRIRFGWETVGEPKVKVVAKELKNINPFCNVIAEQRTGEDIIDNLLVAEPKADIIVDAMDDARSKLYVRQMAKRLKIPVIMTTDIGDNVMIDIERYDLNPQPEPFLGRWKNYKDVDFDKLSMSARRKIIMNIVGLEQHSEEMLASLLSIGKKLSTWPQLAATAAIAGGVTTTTIKKIILKEKIKSGRYFVSLDELFVSDWSKTLRVKERLNLGKKLNG